MSSKAKVVSVQRRALRPRVNPVSRIRRSLMPRRAVTIVPQKSRRVNFLDKLSNQFITIFKHAAGSTVLVLFVVGAFILFSDYTVEGNNSILMKLVNELNKITFLQKFSTWIKTNPHRFLATIMHVGVFWGLKDDAKRFIFISIALLATLVSNSFLEIAIVDFCVYTFVNITDLEIRLITIIAAIVGWLVLH